MLFDKGRSTIAEHLQNIFASGELAEDSVCRKFRQTAAELIVEWANADKEHMGLTTWTKSPRGKILKSDVSIAKNYLKENELESMGRIVSAFLNLAEERAKRHIPMTMEDWATRIDKFLEGDDRPVLDDAGHVSTEYAKEYAQPGIGRSIIHSLR